MGTKPPDESRAEVMTQGQYPKDQNPQLMGEAGGDPHILCENVLGKQHFNPWNAWNLTSLKELRYIK